MANCVNCGVKRQGTENFCLNCGTKLEEVVPIKTTKRSTINPKQKKMRIASIISIFVIIVGLYGAHLFLNWKYDTSKIIIEMNKAYVKGEHTEFLSFFSIPEKVIEDSEGFYSFIEDEGWDQLRNQIKEEVKILEDDELSNIILDSHGNKLMSVTNEPLLFGLYDRVSFVLHPIKVQAEIPLNETSIVINEQTVTEDEGKSITIGNFLPGEYNWKASAPSEFATIENEGIINVIGDGNNSFIFKPEMEAGMATITSDLPDAVLWVNNKSTGKTVTEITSLGPVPYDGTVTITAEAKDTEGKIVKGEQVAIKSNSAHIKFAHIQDKIASDRKKQLEIEVMRLLKNEHEENVGYYIDNFRYDFENALNSADFSYISGYFPTSSEIQSIYLKEIENHGKIDGYYDYDFQSNTITDIKAIDQNTLYVETAEVFYFYSDDEDYIYNKTKGYTVTINGDQYFITNIEQLTTEKEII
ncbi:hypothetical protein WAX74_04005 [Psychrobacillus sp. FJAT-51614]|uniref:Zinc ribbon domain-containing protein n=1 Tax=Psychrobacillus mangrovi TaxID=3117745 RepID=A0ABU8F3I8_9BACI